MEKIKVLIGHNSLLLRIRTQLNVVQSYAINYKQMKLFDVSRGVSQQLFDSLMLDFIAEGLLINELLL